MRSLKSLFNISSGTTTPPANETQNAGARRTGETYKQYGERLAATSNANNYVLQPTLQSVYLSIKKEQQANNILQQRLRQKQQVEINNTQAQMQMTKNNLNNAVGKCNQIEDDIKSCEKEIGELKISAQQRNHQAWLHLIISGVLLVPFTIYFFIFYSSVAYSAFFYQIDVNNLGNANPASHDNGGLANAIFDPNAVPNALQDGIMEAMFILFMPVIFLAFGYVLHRFEQQAGKVKYFKVAAIITVAFIFDALLAFGVSKKLYEIDVMTRLGEVPPYTFSLAFASADFWTIICLGFVSYLIWGITFGFFMNALESLDMKRIQIDILNNKIEVLKFDLASENKNKVELENSIAGLDAKIKNLQLEMLNSVLYDKTAIKLELNNFISGWQNYMGFATKPESEKNQAQDTFNAFLASLDANSNVAAVAPASA